MVAKIRRIIASFSIQNVMNGFIARVYPSRNRVPQGALERLEQYAGKLACTVLRGLGGSNASRLLGGDAETCAPQGVRARRVPIQSFRERLASLTRKSRHAAHRLKALEMGMYLIGCSYN